MMQKRDSTLNKKLCTVSELYRTVCVYFSWTHQFDFSISCSDVLFFTNYYSVAAFKFEVLPRVQWVMSCISNTEMPLCRVVLKLAVILGCSAFSHNRALKRCCWSRTIISTPSKNDSRNKAFHPLVVSSGLVVWSVQTGKNILLFIKNICKCAFYFWWHS